VAWSPGGVLTVVVSKSDALIEIVVVIIAVACLIPDQDSLSGPKQ
jgi:hypothetical protein